MITRASASPTKPPVERSSVQRSVPMSLASRAIFETAPLNANNVAAAIVIAYPTRGRRWRAGVPGGSTSSVIARGYREGCTSRSTCAKQ